MALSYDEGRESRVCDDCFAVLEESDTTDTPSYSEMSLRKRTPGALQVN